VRRFLSALIALGLIIILLEFLNLIPDFGNVDLSKRVSNSFINKSVDGNNETIEFKKSKDLEDGSANVVTSIVVNYRSFDTLGEVTVLFTAALGVGLILKGLRRKRFYREPNFILKTANGILLPLIFLFGAYIFIHGHLTPGGGFPGGTIIAAGILVLYLSNEKFELSHRAKILESGMGTVYVLFGLVGLILSGIFLRNFLPTGVIGELFSAGIVPLIYVAIGFKVGAELSNLISEFQKEGQQ
jgi:multicomponent Na+:H+ antiporter subunit B